MLGNKNIDIFSCRSVPEVVVENIFRIFDPQLSGSIRFTDLLIAFSMSMKGSGEICDSFFFLMIRRKCHINTVYLSYFFSHDLHKHIILCSLVPDFSVCNNHIS